MQPSHVDAAAAAANLHCSLLRSTTQRSTTAIATATATATTTATNTTVSQGIARRERVLVR